MEITIRYTHNHGVADIPEIYSHSRCEVLNSQLYCTLNFVGQRYISGVATPSPLLTRGCGYARLPLAEHAELVGITATTDPGSSSWPCGTPFQVESHFNFCLCSWEQRRGEADPRHISNWQERRLLPTQSPVIQYIR